MNNISRSVYVLSLSLIISSSLGCKEQSHDEVLATLSPQDQQIIRELNQISEISMQSEQAATIKGITVVGMELVKESNFPELFTKETDVEKQRELLTQSAIDKWSLGEDLYLFFYVSSGDSVSPISASIAVIAPEKQRIYSFNDVEIWKGAATDPELGFLPSSFFLKVPFAKTYPAGDYNVLVKLNAGLKEPINFKKTLSLN